jgi:hypothetical protein
MKNIIMINIPETIMGEKPLIKKRRDDLAIDRHQCAVTAKSNARI